MESAAPRHAEIKRIGTSEIRIEWSDGHVSLYPNHYLRNHCPCALCRERPPHLLPVRSQGGEELHPLQIGLVGRYAINIQWSDGHDSGIYSYQTLRNVCPCCAERRDDPGPAT